MIVLPKRKPGRQSAAAIERYQGELNAFCQAMKQIWSTLDFGIGVREWGYLLEEHGLTKGEFGALCDLITQCRKDCLLPLDICHDDDNRATIGIQYVHDASIEECAQNALDTARYVVNTYTPHGFWDDQPYYVELWAEKLSLRNMFESVCKRYYVPLANAKGWSDLNMRAAVMRRFRDHGRAGRQCVLLYIGDFDPGGLAISDTLHSNFKELEKAVGWNPDGLIIDRFGLNYDFIMEQGLSWVENLETSSGKRLDDPKHADFNKPYVQNYLKQYGARKVEASALVTRVVEGRALCEAAIRKYVNPRDVETYEQSLIEPRIAVNEVLTELLRAA
jgi:hypothetical protein